MTKQTSERVRVPQPLAPESALTVEFLHGRALAMLARREYSQHEIRQKLSALGAELPLIEQVLGGLLERRLQSDERFAEIYLRSRAERGYGPRSIQAELRQKGVSAELIEHVFSVSGYDWVAQANALRQRRFGRSIPTEMREKARQLRFLQYRGFTAAETSRVLRTEATTDIADEPW